MGSSVSRRRVAGFAVAAVLSCAVQQDPIGSSSARIEGNATTHGDPGRSGVYSDAVLTSANVKSSAFGLVGSYQVDGPIYAQPIVVDNPGPKGPAHLLVVATTKNNLYLFDADNIGAAPYAVVTSTDLGLPVNLMAGCNSKPWPLNVCGNISWDGILSTPVVSNGKLYFVSVTPQNVGCVGPNETGHLVHHLYALDLTQDLSGCTGGACPALSRSAEITPQSNGVSFAETDQLQRAGLVAFNDRVYVAFSATCDVTPYRGWVVSFDTATLDQTSVWCSTCGGGPALSCVIPTGLHCSSPNAAGSHPICSGGGVWQSGVAPAQDSTGDLFFLTGNGAQNPPGALANSAIELAPSLSLQSYYSPDPSTACAVNYADLDLGSGGAVYLPSLNMVLAGGKAGKMFAVRPGSGGGSMTLVDSRQVTCVNDQPTLDEIASTENGKSGCPKLSATPTQTADCASPSAVLASTDLSCVLSAHPTDDLYPQIHGTPVVSAGNVYVWGQRDYLRQLSVDSAGFHGPVTRSTWVTPIPSLGGMLSMAVNTLDGDETLLATTALSTSSADVTPTFTSNDRKALVGNEKWQGSLVMYDASSLDWLNEIDDLGPPDHVHWAQAKYTPPTIYDGRVYVATNSNAVLVLGTQDLDGDGVADWRDNCVGLANPNQENTNAVAEQLKEVKDGCPHFGGVCPSSFDLPAGVGTYADDWHKVFFGDACDEVATTTGSLAAGASFENGDTNVCVNIKVSNGGGGGSLTVGGSCPMHLHSVVQFDSWIGNATGKATPPNISGHTQPAFCECSPQPGSDVASLAVCQLTSGCILANDTTFLGATNNGLSKWMAMTARAGTVDTTFAPTQTWHQERIGIPPPLSVTTNWDFTYDITAAAFIGQQNNCGIQPFYNCTGNELVGVLWSHVMDFNGGAKFCTDRNGTCNLVEDLDNHYAGMTVDELPTLNVEVTPVAGPIFHIGPWLEGLGDLGDPWVSAALPWVFGVKAAAGTEVVAQLGSEMLAVTNLFDPNALSLFGSVVGGTMDMLVGDDVATGILRPEERAAPVVMLTAGTTQVAGALSVSGGTVGGVIPSPVGTADPPLLRAYSAYDRTLYALGTQTSGMTLTAVDVAAALGGVAKQTTVAVRNVVPSQPVAMVWHGGRRLLYVADVEPDAGNKKRLRLLVIDTAGSGHELWRAEPVSKLPDQVTLTTNAAGELVLALVGIPGNGTSEVLALDDLGRPKLSHDFPGRLLLPALAVPAGVDLPFARHQGNKGTESPLDDVMRPRGDFSPGICGAAWLRSHADTTFPSPPLLASTDVGCAQQQEQEQGE